MIKRLKYHEIDFEKYNRCIEESIQQNFYVKREILDHLCDGWELLIWNNYEFVMPLPVKKKWGFRFVVMPLFCQQLGVFGREDCAEINDRFYNYLSKYYKVVLYTFNHKNQFSFKTQNRKNYFIGRTEYGILRKKYFKGRKSTVKTARFHEFKELVLEENILSFTRKNQKGLSKTSDNLKFKNYIHFLNSQRNLKIFGAYNADVLTNIAVVASDRDTFYLLALINDQDYKAASGASFLIDRILQQNISGCNLDFMGGNIRGIEIFFKSFGAVPQLYPFLKHSRLKLFMKLFQ